jgi:hypothetical protein
VDELESEPELVEPGLEDPVFGAPGVPGNDPHGEPLGAVPGVFGVFGFIVEGCVLLPGVAGFGEVEPGTVPVGGVPVPVGGGVVFGVWLLGA